MDRYYRDVYYKAHWPNAEGLTKDNAACYERWELPIMKALWSEWSPPSGGSVAEIGCGYAAMLPMLQREGYSVMGCDPSVDAVKFCRGRGLDVVEGGFPGTTLPGPFDVVLCQHVIEHVPDPRAFVAELVGITRPGGVAVIVTEDGWNTQYGWNRFASRARGRMPSFHTSTDHTYVFSASHLERLLRESGCDQVRTRSFSHTPVGESLHWRAYKGLFRSLDRLLGRGDYLMAVGRRSNA
jgi:SAM-dependent methyltransferase